MQSTKTMKKIMIVYCLSAGFCLLFTVCGLKGQGLAQKLSAAVKLFEKDDQLKHGIFSLYIIDSKTGNSVYDKNSQLGLSPASSQKVITSVTAMELLGAGYRYKTLFGYDGEISAGKLFGRFHMNSFGDPTFGSWRYTGTSPSKIKSGIIEALRKRGIKSYFPDWGFNDRNFESQSIPGGWLWEDIGNYYGAGHMNLNWRENQADVFLKSDEITGDSVQIISIEPSYLHLNFVNELKKGKPGSGDNAYFFYAIGELPAYFRGTIPPKEKKFSISISVQDSYRFFIKELKDSLDMADIKTLEPQLNGASTQPESHEVVLPKIDFIYTHYSPTLDSINYWFLKKSVNLYGEALVKTMAFEKKGFGSTVGGLEIIHDFWLKKGIEKSALNMLDGSGLSPQNRVTAHALVTALQYAKTRSWYNSFYRALPEINGIKMKSGSIGGVRSYTGYIKNKSGKEYTFAFIVNNYSGSSAAIVNKMWKLLDLLK